MITGIVIDQYGQSHIRRYATDDPREARDRFVQDWIDGGVIWEHSELHGELACVRSAVFARPRIRRRTSRLLKGMSRSTSGIAALARMEMMNTSSQAYETRRSCVSRR